MSSKVSAVANPSADGPALERFQISFASSTDLTSLMHTPSCGGPVAFLVLLPAAARTRVVAADFGFVAADLFDGRIVAADARRLLRTAGARRRLRARRGRPRRAEDRRVRRLRGRIVH